MQLRFAPYTSRFSIRASRRHSMTVGETRVVSLDPSISAECWCDNADSKFRAIEHQSKKLFTVCCKQIGPMHSLLQCYSTRSAAASPCLACNTLAVCSLRSRPTCGGQGPISTRSHTSSATRLSRLSILYYRTSHPRHICPRLCL